MKSAGMSCNRSPREKQRNGSLRNRGMERQHHAGSCRGLMLPREVQGSPKQQERLMTAQDDQIHVGCCGVCNMNRV
jgi:hypothetical protein